ncbi:cupin-like domain-containing protein, partial [Blastocladiella britannica]
MAKKRTTIKLKWNIQPLEEDVEPQSPPSPPSPAPAVKTQQQPQNAEFANRYSGFHPPSADWKLPRIRADTPDPQEFYEKYIATRTPCVLTHGSATPWAKGVFANWSSLAYLKEKAGNENIMVEEAGAPGLFGTSRPRIPTTFGAFLDALPTSPQVYLTTQYAAEPDKDDEGMRVTDVYPPPLSPLLSDISPVPPLLARLVPQQHNLWIGSTPIGTPSSSGLHHDHADNLYVLVSGHKTFTLFSPRDTALMDVHGSVREVHPNGYIAYEHGLRGDGAFALDAAEWR